MIRYIDDFVMCFQYREDALRVQDALCKRLGKFGLTLEPSKTKLVELAGSRNDMPPNTQEAPRNDLLSGVHALLHAEPEGQLQDWNAHREISLAAQSHVVAGPAATNTALVGPGTGQHSQRRAEGPLRLLRRCRKLSFPAKGPSGGRTLLAQMLCSRSWAGRVTWDMFHQIKQRQPILRPKLYLPIGSYKLSQCCESSSEERSAGNLHATFCGNRGGRPPPVTRWAASNGRPYRDTLSKPRKGRCAGRSGRGTGKADTVG